jgi:hypothetical protein
MTRSRRNYNMTTLLSRACFPAVRRVPETGDSATKAHLTGWFDMITNVCARQVRRVPETGDSATKATKTYPTGWLDMSMSSCALPVHRVPETGDAATRRKASASSVGGTSPQSLPSRGLCGLDAQAISRSSINAN